MTHFAIIPFIPVLSSTVYEPPDGVRGRAESGGLFSIANELLDTDSTGTMTLVLRNIVAGSTYEVEVISTGELVVADIATGAAVTLTIPVYPSGSPRNELRIKARKGSSSPYYQPYETQTTATVGAQSIFINQLLDE
jgi:hypothetical protein